MDVEFSITKINKPQGARKLRAQYTVELYEDLKSMWGDGWLGALSPAENHLSEKKTWLGKYLSRIKKLNGIEKRNLQQKIDTLTNEIENHEILFAEYYL